MPTQRPFLSNFLAAFRAHSQTLPAKPSPTSAAASATSASTLWTSAAAAAAAAKHPLPTDQPSAAPRAITSKTQPYSPVSSTPQEPAQQHLSHTISPATHLPSSASSSSSATSSSSGSSPATSAPTSAVPTPRPLYPTCQEVHAQRQQQRRRGSDSSDHSSFSSGSPGASPALPLAHHHHHHHHHQHQQAQPQPRFREIHRGDGTSWFIGGRTPGGEDKYYKLSMVKRECSADRLSADRLSL